MDVISNSKVEEALPKRSKNHHYVPKVLQRQFLAEDEQVWYSERETEGGYCAPYLKNIDKAFYARNYYTITDGHERSDIVEREYYGRIDNYLGQVIPRFVDCLKRGISPVFEGDALDSIRRVTVEMAKRTPDFTKRHDEQTIGLEIADATLSALPNDPENTERKKILAAKDDANMLRAIGRTVRVRSTISPSKKVDAILKEFSVRWSAIPSHHSYILSSRMAYMIGNGGPNGFSNPEAELWMPVSPKFALVLLRDPHNKIPLMLKETTSHVRQVNEYAARNSNQIASHSRKLIESITGKTAVLRQPND